MKLINSVLTFAALFTWLADAEVSVSKDTGKLGFRYYHNSNAILLIPTSLSIEIFKRNLLQLKHQFQCLPQLKHLCQWLHRVEVLHRPRKRSEKYAKLPTTQARKSTWM